MKKMLFLVTLVALMGLQLSAQNVTVSKALFKQGDDMSWANPEMDDASWSEIDITKLWDKQGFPQNTRSYGWYRIHVNIPKSVLNGADQQNALIFNLPKADDVDECFLNGKMIGATGRMPTDAAGYFPANNAVRNYVVDIKKDGLRLDAENVIAVRVYNRGGSGGLYNNPLTISCPKAAEGLSMQLTDTNVGQYHYDIEVNNAYLATTTGTLDVTITDRETGAKVKSLTKKLSIKRNKPVCVTVPYTMDKMCQLTATYTDAKTGKVLTESELNCIIPLHGCRYLKVKF